MGQIKSVTLGELRTELQGLLKLPNSTLVTFGNGDLTLNRLKDRGPVEGPAMINFEFTQLYSVTLDPTADD